MKLSQLFLILLARKKLILTVMLLSVAAAVALSLLMPKTYKASSQVITGYRATDPVTGNVTPQPQMQSYLATQVGIITSRNVALKVVDALQLTEVPELRREFEEEQLLRGDLREWIAARLLKKVDASPLKEGGLIEIGFKWDDADFAASVANAFAHQYRQASIEIRTNPLDEVSGYFDQQLKELRTNLANAQGRLSQYQKDKGIVSVDSRLDHETLRLNELSNQLVEVQNQLMDANYRQQQARGANAGDSPDVVSNQLIQNLKASLAVAEAKLAQMDKQFTPNHPSHIGATAEVESLRQELQRNTRITANSIANTAAILKQRERELSRSLQDQKERVLQLNTERDQLAILAREVESAQRAYDNTMNRLSQINLEGRANQTDVSILSEAVPPTEPASPKLMINLLLSLVLGTMLGAAAAFISEMRNRKIRHADELIDLLHAPVIGVMEWSAPKIQRAQARLPGATKLLSN
jgi:succinoglycan biosynthesis transport protein ExoP